MNLLKRYSTVLAASGVLVAASLTVPSSWGPAADASTGSLCSRVSPSTVASTLGVKIAHVSKVVNGNVTVCWYQIGSLTHAAFIRSQTGDNLEGFAADQKLAGTYHENPKSDPNFKPNKAFSTTLGSATYGYTYSVEVLKNTTVIAAGATKVTLAKVEALAKKVAAAS